MADLVDLHLLDDGAAAQIIRGQAIEVIREMALDLTLRFRHESEARPIAEKARERPDGDGARVPHRIQQGRTRTELIEPVPAPGEVVAFFRRGVTQRGLGFRVAGGEGLALVEALGSNFPGVIDPHEARGMPSPRRVGRRSARISGGRAAARRPRKAPAQAGFGQIQEAVEG
jgi:hypothetical protein